jgi:cytochrome c1
MTKSLGLGILGTALSLLIGVGAANAAGDALPHIDRQAWTFAGFRGYFDNNQLQRGFLVYKEVCSSCHGLKRVAFRNLSEKGGPEFAEEGVKALAATYKIVDGPNDQGKMFKRPGRLSDYVPSPFSNENEARSANNGALPPDLSVITKARGIEVERSFFSVPFHMLKDVANGYQEAGPDYVYALLTGYDNAPSSMKIEPGMNYNKYFPGQQVAMASPLQDGMVKYTDGTPATVPNYARDVVAFLSWAADPKLEERKNMGMLVMLYLLITTLLLYLAKKRVWSKVDH